MPPWCEQHPRPQHPHDPSRHVQAGHAATGAGGGAGFVVGIVAGAGGGGGNVGAGVKRAGVAFGAVVTEGGGTGGSENSVTLGTGADTAMSVSLCRWFGFFAEPTTAMHVESRPAIATKAIPRPIHIGVLDVRRKGVAPGGCQTCAAGAA